MRVTERVVDFINETTLKVVSEEVQHLGKRAILDTLGVTLAGSGEDSIRILLETMGGQQGNSKTSLIGIGLKTDSLSAAMINGTMAHALDFDDVNDSCMGHPSAPVLPAVIALGEETNASGAELLEAFLIGFEVECKLGAALGKTHYAKGWHPTATLGTIGAAAASAKLLGLDKKGIEAALGIAASLASGIRINFGTMTKPLHVGNAARNGVLASLLASRRFTATANIFDHELDFGQVFSEDDMDKNHLIESLGSPWDILSPGVTVKKYPCCNKTHRTLDATLKLALDKGIHPDNIATIVVTIPPGEDVPLIYNKATTPLEGKFSMQFCVASAIVDGKIDFDTFTSKNVARHQVQQLSDKVLVVTDENQAPVVIDSGGHVTVTITMKDGSSMDRRISKATGTPTYPLSDHELNEKFTACASKAIDSKEIEKALERIYSLDYVTTVAQLMEPLCPSLLVGVNHD